MSFDEFKSAITEVFPTLTFEYIIAPNEYIANSVKLSIYYELDSQRWTVYSNISSEFNTYTSISNYNRYPLYHKEGV